MRFIFIVLFLVSFGSVCIGKPLSDEKSKFFSHAKDFNNLAGKYLKTNQQNNYSLATKLFDQSMALSEAIHFNGVLLDLWDYSVIIKETLILKKLKFELKFTMKKLKNHIQSSEEYANSALNYSTDNALLFRVDKFRADIQKLKAKLDSELEKR